VVVEAQILLTGLQDPIQIPVVAQPATTLGPALASGLPLTGATFPTHSARKFATDRRHMLR